MMKKEKRFGRVPGSRTPLDQNAIEDDMLAFEGCDDQRSLLRKMDKLRRMKSYFHFLLF
jgi:hypothetical protein